MSQFVVLSSGSGVSPVIAQGQVKERLSPTEIVVKFSTHVHSFEKKAVYPDNVTLYTVSGATTPCPIPLPKPYNSLLLMGPFILFQLGARQDFVQLWNEACVSSVSWKHNRPKKTDDPLQKLGLPPKLNDFLRDQVLSNGLEVPNLSDDELTDQADVMEGEKESVYETSSGEESEATSIEYYTGNEDEDGEEEEEEEDEQDPEPEEEIEEDDQ
jgi:hypothetical protein